MKRTTIFIIVIAITIITNFAKAQNFNSAAIQLKWQSPITVNTDGGLTIQYLKFDEAILQNSGNTNLPYYFFKQEVTGIYNYDVKIINAQTDLATDVYAKNTITNNFEIKYGVAEERGKYFLTVTILPLKRNINGQLEKLNQFELQCTATTANKFFKQKNAANKKSIPHSVLASGSWYQLATTADGIYKIDASTLQQMGINTSTINPKNIRIYGNGGGNIPESNSINRPDDLTELAIQVVGENDNTFDSGDYILFYGQQPDNVFYNTTSKLFYHEKNLYANKTFYYITTDLGAGKRITSQASTTGANKTITSFDDYQYNDEDGINLAHTGRAWFNANDFDNTPIRNYGFVFNNLITSENINFATYVAAQSVAPTAMSVFFNGNNIGTLSFGAYAPGYDLPVATTDALQKVVTSGSDNISIQFSFSKNSNIAGTAWIDYISVQARRQLTMSGNQMIFKDARSVGAGNISNFIVSNASGSTVWDILNPLEPFIQQGNYNGSQFSFTIPTDTLHQFISFNGNSFLTPTLISTVSNQDIHAQINNSPELIIVSYPDFMSAASQLATFHQNTLHQKTLLVSTTQVYHEFGSGKPDIGAIRDMMKTFYDAAGNDTSKMPKYLLLMGDGSYDNRNIISGNTAYIPTYESSSSIAKAGSYTSDDFFGLLSNNEGKDIDNGVQYLDISVGRIPCKSLQEANQVVNKIISYKSAASFGSWRNTICFVADDEDQNTHIDAADNFAKSINSLHPEFNIDKIYFDSYKQVESSSGSRYPEVHDAIIRRIESGTSVLNYTGHGGEGGWAHERVFETPDINNLENENKLALFVTATCEFSRFDIPEMVTGGEALLLNPKGGAIALLTTVRLVYTGGNEEINKNIYKYFFNKNNDGTHISIGEVFRLAKNATTTDENNRKFTLLGDPALALNFPEYKISNLTINKKNINNDTLKAFGKYTITGKVTDLQNNLLSSFNGIIYPTIFDKTQTVSTLANDPYPQYQGGSKIKNYALQKNAVYKGKASIKNGYFSYTFIVPKDISYSVGKGKFSYYGNDATDDAIGFDGSLNVGSYADSVIKDKQGPIINIYMNDLKFANGGTTNTNPT
ncbi:MAG: type secretion system sortase PorU, partial [Bacteroidota bacterium]